MEPGTDPKAFGIEGFSQQTQPMNTAPQAPFSGNWLMANRFPGAALGGPLGCVPDMGGVGGSSVMFQFDGGVGGIMQPPTFRGFGLATAQNAAIPPNGLQQRVQEKSESERMEQFLKTVETLHQQYIATKKQGPFQPSVKPKSTRAMAESVAEKCMELYFKLVVEYVDPSVTEEVSARTNFVRLAFEDLRDWLSKSGDGLFNPEEPSGMGANADSGSDSYEEYDDYGSEAPSELVKMNEAAAREYQEKGLKRNQEDEDEDLEKEANSGDGKELSRAPSTHSFDSALSHAAAGVRSNATNAPSEKRKSSGETASSGDVHEGKGDEHASSPVLPLKRGKGDVLDVPKNRRLRSKVSLSGGGWTISRPRRNTDESGLAAVDENGDGLEDEEEDEDEKDFSTTTLPNLASMMQRVNLNIGKKGKGHGVGPQHGKGQSIKLVQELSFIVSKYSTTQSLADIGKATQACIYYLLPDVAFGGLYLFEPSTGKLTMPWSKGFSPQEKEEALETALDRHPGKVMRSRQMMKVDDTATADQKTGGISSERGWIVRSRLWLPIARHGGDENSAYGAIGFGSARSNAFTKDHLNVLRLLCNLIEVSYAAIYARARIKGRFHYTRESMIMHQARGTDNALMFISVKVKDSEKGCIDELISIVESSVAQTRGEVVTQLGPDQLATFVSNPGDDEEKLQSKEMRACMCALSIREGLALYSDVAKFHVGIHTGHVIECKSAGLVRAGRTGSKVKSTITLADLARMYGVEMVCTNIVLQTIDRNQCPMAFLELDTVMLADGAETPIQIYQVMRREENFLNRDITGAYEAGLCCYRQGQWEVAISKLQQISEVYPPASVLIERSRKYWKEGAPAGWDGVWKVELR